MPGEHVLGSLVPRPLPSIHSFASAKINRKQKEGGVWSRTVTLAAPHLSMTKAITACDYDGFGYRSVVYNML